MLPNLPVTPSLRLPIPGGVLIGVGGPSGAGKDSVIAYASERLDGLSGIAFVRRVITRTSDASSENHDTLDEKAFEQAEARGAFAMTWPAHGLKYGLPASLDTAISSGKVAIANISRAVVPALRARYCHVVIVLVTATPAILAGRLAARGRETSADILVRLNRAASTDCLDGAVEIDNSGKLEAAGERFVGIILKARERASSQTG